MIALLGFGWLRPELAPALLLGPLVAGLAWWALSRRERALASAFDARLLPAFARELRPGRAALRLGLGSAAALLAAAALLGPVRGSTTREVRQKGVDLCLCLDTSRSMLARDVRPDRLTRAVREITGLAELTQGDRLALLAFSGDARDVAPLTRDRAALLGLLARVTPDENRLGGTDLAAAVDRALDVLASSGGSKSGAHQAIVLLTDGEDLGGEGLAAAERARGRGVRVYVVGLATEAGGKIPLAGKDGSESFLRDRDGGEVVSRLGRDTLERLAQATGGEYRSVEDSPTPLEDLWKHRISRLDRYSTSGGVIEVPHDRYQWWLGLALCLMLIEVSLSDRRPAARPKAAPVSSVAPASSAAMASASAVLVAAVLTAGVARAQSAPPRSFGGTAREGLAEIARLDGDAKHDEAVAIADALLARTDAVALAEPLAAEVGYARGLALANGDKAIDAVSAFQRARALAGPGTLRLDASYGAGTALLLEAERVFAIAQQPTPPAAGAGGPIHPAPGPAPVAAPEGPDPLTVAKLTYLGARSLLLEHLRLDPRDPDARANLELAMRRLRQIEEIEKQRAQQDPEKSEQTQDGEPPKDDKKPPPDQEPKDPNQSDSQTPNDEKPPEDGSQQPEPKPGDERQPEPGDPDSPESGEKPPGESPEEQPPKEEPTGEPPAGEPENAEMRPLSREELRALLDRLAEIEKDGAALRAALRKAARKPVEKDW